eukprot:TRINITY_DN28615_c0_g1_i1.p1 TRINITY_DN28615_c0_g1~~TRINITY_DN28615_c0_g1_i1.p1  ORF type:complete len:397 (-),score=52.11 TRINITY_DN28615_c0_g1_i1:156-1250(-)
MSEAAGASSELLQKGGEAPKLGAASRKERHVVDSMASLATKISKAPRATVVIPELADEESPEGWQIMGQTCERVTGSVREFLENALADLTSGIPEEYRNLPQVEEQRAQLRELIQGRNGEWNFTVELNDPPLPSGMEQHAEGETPPWLQAFLDGEDGKGSFSFHADGDEQKPVELGSAPSLKRCVIAPGNGCEDIVDSNWYGWLADELRARSMFKEVVCRDFPDPYIARRSVWIPFMRDDLQVGPDTVLVGHSSGAVAAMRFAEEHPVGGIVLVAAYHSDLEDETERESGYFPPSGGPWNFDAIRKNAGWIIQFHSKDDHLVPVQEARTVAEKIRSEYHELKDKSHFFEPFEEILTQLQSKLKP